jgi:hypothetical protein
MNFIGGCPTIKLTQFIADMRWIHYAYLRRFMIVKPINQKEVNHENLASCKNLDRLPRDKLEKKYRPGEYWDIVHKVRNNWKWVFIESLYMLCTNGPPSLINPPKH